MKHEVRVRYPVPASAVMKLFTDKDFHARKLTALGVSNFRILESQAKGKDFSIRIELRVSLNVPSLIKKFLPAETVAIHEESWNTKSQTGSICVSNPSQPIEMTCATRAEDDGEGCLVTYAWDVKAKFPLVGGAVEKFICSDIQGRGEREQQAVAGLVGKKA